MSQSKVIPVGAPRESVRSMFASIAHRYDLANSALSFGIHHLWRRALLRSLPGNFPKNSCTLDLCTGTGDLLPLLETRSKTVIGGDFCYPMMEAGAAKLKEPKFLQVDGLEMSFKDESFDLITVSFGVRNFESLERGLEEIFRVLKKGGELRILEFGQPSIFGISTFFKFYSKYVMPLIGGLLTGNREAYEYLPQTSAKFPCRKDFCDILSTKKFESPWCRVQSFGIAYLYGAKKPL